MPTQFYPRSQVKKTLKAHTNRPLSKSVDVLVFLDYVIFMRELIKEASIKSKQSGDRGITAKSVRKVRGDVLRRFKA